MKKIMAIALAMVMLFTLAASSAAAAGTFSKSVFENSRDFTKNANGSWSLRNSGYYIRSGQSVISVNAVLTSNGITNKTGPELTVTFTNDLGKRTYDKVTAFRATVDGKEYIFDKLGEITFTYTFGEFGKSPEYKGTQGYVAGCETLKSFMEALDGCRSVSFEIDHKPEKGSVTTFSIDHVHTGELSDVQSICSYILKSNAFSVVEDLEKADEKFDAKVK